MTDIAVIILVFAIIFIIAFVILPAWRQHHDKDSTLSLRTQNRNEAVINDALKQLNCRGRWSDDGADRIVRYDYQNGHFRIRLSRESPYARVFYLFFYDTGIDNLEIVRSLCNQCNLNTENCRIVYTVNQEKGLVDLHIICGVLLSEGPAHEVLSRTMSSMFSWQALFARRMDELTSGESSDARQNDVEKNVAQAARELYLLREQEIMHQDAGPSWRENKQDTLKLGHLLSVVMDLKNIQPIAMNVDTDDGRTVVQGEQVPAYDLATVLIADGAFVRQSALLELTFTSVVRPGVERHLVIHLQSEQGDDTALYYRITLTLVPLAVEPNIPVKSLANRPQTKSLLMAYDLTDSQKRVEEFRYMWKEALQKTKRGQENELTEGEKLISKCVDPHVGYNLYRGHALMLQKRYYEALAHLNDAYASLKGSFDKLSRSERARFYEVSYYIGFCYNNLHQYEHALYYLEQVAPLHRITYTEEYINCLVNSGDVRAMNIIDSLLAEVGNPFAIDDDTEHDKATESFVRFLYRRKAYLYVAQEAYDEAERLLKKMLDDPESSDFALNELAYLQKRKSTNSHITPSE